MAVLQIKNLTKQFGSFTAVNNISFDLKEGEILGLLGPNGAGKTTTIQMLLGITTPNSGSIRYFDKDFSTNRQECLRTINYTSAFNALQGRTTVWENLIVFANLYLVDDPKKKILKLVDYFEIKNLLNSQYKHLSSGEKTRVNFIKALLNDPKVILMDEPTASLDPDIADKTLSLIEQIKQDNKISILYTSHNMNEIDRICDRVIFLSNGKIVAEDTPINLTKKIETTTLRLTFDKGKEIIEKYLTENKQEFEFSKDNIVIIKTKEKLVPKIIFGISSEGIWMTDIEIQKPTLEDVFLQISRSK
ncbi:MAG: ABC transporter, ATPase subunit [Candidatus Roizmanbacteria bacterium GW2011_GWA2_33_33]|uniref:ABC transporter, ATPase subunit n=2 Tax=Candidatus Roizmaniibacteriota TaxID=1752723 RepID=A0A0G0DDN3_9BACT|nr:MAG: ABC transporter, ATPase subunit [Candidatus Roizmanbacteria bacterium GW2011_GWA2_33_33]KKP61370.1 MAG: ABC transporter, ATPase subunit [Candidatus Roizmanbacteria bacterium GW2011_GWC2_34_23]